MENENHSIHKNAMGKLYEKFLMTKKLSDLLNVGYALNTETGRKEVVLLLQTEDQTIPVGNLWSAHDFNLRDYDHTDSAIISKVFEQYASVDERETLDEFNNDYHPKDKNYDEMWTFIDEARAVVKD